MKVILPVAGLGTRMRPHTWSKPKPLLNVAGKAVLGHVLDTLKPLDIDEVVFVVGWLGDQIKDYVAENYDFPAHYVVQEELKGQAHAIYLAKEYISGPCLIVFVDTLFAADISVLETTDADGVLFVHPVEDPRRFGVVVEEEGRIVQLIEKPDTMEHHNVVIGVYYIREGAALVEAIEYILAHNIQTKGEYYIANALQVMIDQGARIISQPVSMWEDCGKPETVLHTHRYLLDHGHTQEIPVTRSVIIPPVHIAHSARIEDAIVGPYVTVGENVTIQRAIIQDTIIEAGSSLSEISLEGSLVGRNATLRGPHHCLNVGDDDLIDLAGQGALA